MKRFLLKEGQDKLIATLNQRNGELRISVETRSKEFGRHEDMWITREEWSKFNDLLSAEEKVNKPRALSSLMRTTISKIF